MVDDNRWIQIVGMSMADADRRCQMRNINADIVDEEKDYRFGNSN